MKLGAAAQAKSRTFFALNRHVRVGVGLAPEDRGRGRVTGWPTSVFATMGTVVSDLSAVARRAGRGGGGTATGVPRGPRAAATKPAGTGGAESKAPDSRGNLPWPRSCSACQARTSSET